MLDQARRLLGTGEYPPGSNHNFVTVWYGVDAPWCDMAVSYAAAHSDNLAAVVGKYAWTVGHAPAVQPAGRWHYGPRGGPPRGLRFLLRGGGALPRSGPARRGRPAPPPPRRRCGGPPRPAAIRPSRRRRYRPRPAASRSTAGSAPRPARPCNGPSTPTVPGWPSTVRWVR